MTDAGQPGGRDLAKAYRPADFEGPTYERWLAADVFAPDGAGSRADWTQPPFVIIQPPPNVTGSLHLGHAQRTAVEDLLVRHARMRGRPALFLPGLDHASIAAQFVLDRIIAAEGHTRESLGRDRYLERMREFVEATRITMLTQQRRVGASADWSRLRFTMDEMSSRAVRTAFARLHRDGLVYRTEALVNWCPGCRTSVSDLEVVATPETGWLWRVRYHLLDEATGQVIPNQTITVATTRPETILGDTAVAVHPDDPRYQAFVGRRVRIPFVERDVPIIADPVVDRQFGTGAVKVTPAHDHDDHQTGLRHGLPAITILDDRGTVTADGAAYMGLDRFEARARIVADLDAAGDLDGIAPHELVIGRCQRSNDILEPLLKTQWFVRTGPLAASALAATRSGQTRILPERFTKTWEHWLTGIRDWNVSRQLWWGHRIPAWYCPDGHITVSEAPEGPAACATCARAAGELRQDPDIFDTWFSSGLWPFSTLGWPMATPDLATYYPGSVMETGYDILFFWIARMMMLGIQLTGDVPFQTVYLSGLIRDPEGRKMSKTKGNVVDPLGVIEETGADALRFALIHGATPGLDQRFGQSRLESARNFANKLWNATRFVIGARPASIAPGTARQAPDAAALGPAERWILSRAAASVAAVDRALADLNLGEVTRLLHDAIWNELCDWGIELAKVRLSDASLPAAHREATWWTLVEALDTYLRLLHPVMPFVTEELWAALPHTADDPSLLIVARWPAGGSTDEVLDREVAVIIDLVRGIRNARSEARVEPAAWLPVHAIVPGALGPTFDALGPALERMARARPLVRSDDRAGLAELLAEGGLSVIVGDAEAVIGLARSATNANADAADRQRLGRELADATTLLAAARERLANPSFVSRAPAAVVAGARASESELAAQVDRLVQRLGGPTSENPEAPAGQGSGSEHDPGAAAG